MARSLEHAGINDNGEESDLIDPNADPHQAFRKLYLQGDDKSESFTSDFNKALGALQQDVLIHSSVVFTTFSNSADKTLTKNFRPTVLIGDEIGAALEAELLVRAVGS